MSYQFPDRPTGARTRASPFGEIDPHDLPVRPLDLDAFRQTAPSRDADDLRDVAESSGRYHRRGEPSPLYASSTEDAAWGELFRHSEPPVSPFEVRRRMSRLRIEALPVLDLTDPEVRALLPVSERVLVSNRPAACRGIADVVRSAPERFGGILAPSAADRAQATLVVMPGWVERSVEVEEFWVRTPPQRTRELFLRILDTLSPRLRDELREIADQARRELRRRRRP